MEHPEDDFSLLSIDQKGKAPQQRSRKSSTATKRRSLHSSSSEETVAPLKPNEDPAKRLNGAVFKGSLPEVVALAQQGVDLSMPIDDNKQNALHMASFGGHTAIVEFLIRPENKLNLNARDDHGWTAFLCAASCGHLEICYLLLQAGADPKLENAQKTTPLHYLCRKVIETSPNTSIPSITSTPPLSHVSPPSITVAAASSSGLQPPVSAPANGNLTPPANHSNNNSNSDLNNSTSSNESVSQVGATAADYKVRPETYYYYELLEMMTKKGADINHQNYFGETPLMQACARGNVGAVHFLLAHKAKWKITNSKGETAQFYAEKGGFQNIVKILQDKMDRELKKSLITHQNVRIENLSEVISIMRDSDSGLVLRDRKYFFITHKKAFLGSELVDWVIKNLPIRTREEATAYGQKLLDSHWIMHVNKKKKFKDAKNSIYKFSTGEAPPEEPKSEKVTIDDFEQIKVLGKGGFGKVVLAQKRDTKKIYALKLMDKAKILNKPRDFKNLMSEKKILQNDCCFLVHLHWAFQTETEFALVMDFVGGGDLYYHWKKMRRFPEKVVQFIGAELVLAMSYLHSCGVIYRDLKPQNILLDIDGHICLADFGLSKEVTQNIDNGLHTACGTPTYSAPEVLDGSPYGKSVDYWSLGVVLYQFLVGRAPFEFDGDFAKLLRSIYTGQIAFPKQLVSENAQSFLEGLLCRDPQKRLDDPEIIKRHPFFKGIDWEKLEVKKVPSPIKVAEYDYAKNFDPKYTRMPVHDDKEEKKAVPNVPEFSVLF